MTTFTTLSWVVLKCASNKKTITIPKMKTEEKWRWRGNENGIITCILKGRLASDEFVAIACTQIIVLYLSP